MELTVRLPQTQSFDVEFDKNHFHSAYANAAKMVFLKIKAYKSAGMPEIFQSIIHASILFSFIMIVLLNESIYLIT